MKIFVKIKIENNCSTKLEIGFQVNIGTIDGPIIDQWMNENTNEKTMFISCGKLQCLFVYINDELQTTVVTVLFCC